ncbi:uncharacterized protein LOC125740870 isoform X3 [Brienomyrus brachyistius]|nr:uncharacterized protein LOC125740870 isoform X3 [Brienomyrus brachyistius]
MFILLILCLGHCLPGASSQGIVCHVGDTVTLPCDGPAATDTKEADVLWVFGGRPVCSYKNGSWCEAGHHVNRIRLGSIQQNNFSLAINPVRKDDAGVYMCRINGGDIQTIRLIVDEPAGDRKQRDAVMPPGGRPFCRPYREREDPPESKTKDKQDSYENPPGASSGGNVIVGIVVAVMAVVAVVGAAVFFKRQWNRQGDENLPDPGPSEHPLINAASGPVGDSSAERMEEPEKTG